ncbi:Radical SAM domain protein [Desulfitobacterium hafniense DCB-2]|uniref:Radical SAM domain protein n=1 Tax=Desulfitobacterium hafniense (strain DSM 10664 / DCB-2) TaxID=272564 RepID=B8FZ95_DESHD|nr:nif11-like peptide radical SAM maturase [Desulfitobacterium hafniense]ACL18178.1 Radical SAM domain protein [Desulfitobacterium hafniense DCB-2]
MSKKEVSPFHLFEYRGHPYLLNIEKMAAHSVSTELLPILHNIREPQTKLPADQEKILRSWDLISECQDNDAPAVQMEPVPITYLYLFLTQSCNLRCIYCYGDGGEYGAGGSMDSATAKQAVDWLIAWSGNMKKIHLGFFGGEPFINFPLMKATVDYAQSKAQEAHKEVAFYVTTNATLLDDEKIAFIKEHQFSVQISFDGPKEIQDAQRPYANGQGSYDSVVPKIKKLLACVPEASGHGVLWGDTNPQLVKATLQDLGFTSITLAPASSSLFADESERNPSSRKTQAQLQALEQETAAWLHHLRSRDKDILRGLRASSGGYGIYPGMIALLHNRRKYHFCGIGRKMVGVSVTGDIYPCHRFVGNDDYKLGHVGDENFNRDDYLQSPPALRANCASCFARYYCAGGCLHDNLSSSGSSHVPSEAICRLRRRELELAAVIVSNLSSDDQAFLVNERIIAPKPCPLDF